jgi:hypothetical protein
MFGLVLLLSTMIFYIADIYFDSHRIKKEIVTRGGQLISIVSSPFEEGWVTKRYDRIYEISYYDSQGNECGATVKTSFFTGVYFTDDEIIIRADKKPQEVSESESILRKENEVLKKEIEVLRRGEMKY